jgi:benzoate membrane transport protein
VILERPVVGAACWRDALRDLDRHNLGNGLVASMIATTGPLAIMLAALQRGGLGVGEITAYVIAAYGLGGIMSILCSLAFRQSLAMAYTIPGIVLVGAAIDHLGYGEIIGAYLSTGVLVFALGMSGWVSRLTAAVPLPIVMAMVAGVFLSFGINLVGAFAQSWIIAGAMVATYGGLAALRLPVPPVLGALAAGIAAVLATGAFTGTVAGPLVAAPTLFMPVFSWRASIELVVPLALTVIGIQNAQGFAVLRGNGFAPPVNTLTALCGLGTLVQGALGAAPLCVTGPANAVLNLSGARERRYVGGIVFGAAILLFGLFAPLMARLALGVPKAFIATLAGLAMLRVLEQAFVAAFASRFTLGALTTFLVTVANLSLLNIGAPFWGLVFGYGISALLERGDFATLRLERDGAGRS